MKKMNMWVTAAAIGVTSVSGVSAFGQAQNAEAQDQQRRERQEQRREGKEAGQASERQDRAERQQMKKEKEQLGNMPQGARRALRAVTEGATEIDYSREGEERSRTFMARYRAPNGHVKETRVDREGKVISDRDETAEAEVAAARARGERAPPPQQPVAQTPAPATPGAPPPAQGTITAANGPTGKLELAQLPRPVQDSFTREIRGANDVEIYRGFQGSQPVFVAYYTEPTNKKEMAIRVNDAGQVVDKKEIDDNQADPSRLTINDLPRPAQETIRRESQNAQDMRIYRGKQGSQDVFVAYYDRGGREVSLRVDDQGKVVSQRPIEDAQTAGAGQKQDPNRALALSDLPRQARESIERESRDGRDVRIYRGKQGQQDVFVAYYTKGGKDMALRVDDQGKVVSNREVEKD